MLSMLGLFLKLYHDVTFIGKLYVATPRVYGSERNISLDELTRSTNAI